MRDVPTAVTTDYSGIKRGKRVRTLGGGVGTFVGERGTVWVAYDDAEPGTFEVMCRRFDERQAAR